MKSLIRKLDLFTSGPLLWLRQERGKSLAVRELERLSDHLLRDIGIERRDIREVVSAMHSAGGRTVSSYGSSLGRNPIHEATADSRAWTLKEAA